MTPVEFQATVENGTIAVPEAYRQQLANGAIVKVIVLKQQKWENFSQQFQQALVDAGYDSREKIIDLIQEVKREMAEERQQRRVSRQSDGDAS